MCLINKKEIQLEKIDAFKLFEVRQNELFSPYAFAYQKAYETNLKLTVRPETEHFYAFKNFDDAFDVWRRDFADTSFPRLLDASSASGPYFVVDFPMLKNAVILPVTMYDVVFEGMFWKYPAYMSKKILVNADPEQFDKIRASLLATTQGESEKEKACLENVRP